MYLSKKLVFVQNQSISFIPSLSNLEKYSFIFEEGRQDGAILLWALVMFDLNK